MHRWGEKKHKSFKEIVNNVLGCKSDWLQLLLLCRLHDKFELWNNDGDDNKISVKLHSPSSSFREQIYSYINKLRSILSLIKKQQPKKKPLNLKMID